MAWGRGCTEGTWSGMCTVKLVVPGLLGLCSIHLERLWELDLSLLCSFGTQFDIASCCSTEIQRLEPQERKTVGKE